MLIVRIVLKIGITISAIVVYPEGIAVFIANQNGCAVIGIAKGREIYGEEDKIRNRELQIGSNLLISYLTSMVTIAASGASGNPVGIAAGAVSATGATANALTSAASLIPKGQVNLGSPRAGYFSPLRVRLKVTRRVPRFRSTDDSYAAYVHEFGLPYEDYLKPSSVYSSATDNYFMQFVTSASDFKDLGVLESIKETISTLLNEGVTL